MTNTLAYYDSELIIMVKNFDNADPGLEMCSVIARKSLYKSSKFDGAGNTHLKGMAQYS